MPTIIEEKDVLVSLKKKMQFDGLIAVIPAYNAEATIADVIRKIKRKVPRCIVVDDGSTDKTAEISDRLNAEIIYHPSNRGKGAAIKSALGCIREDNFNHVIFLDADGQHNPGEIHQFVQKADRSKADVICGNRMRSPQDMPKIRFLTNKYMSILISKICGIEIHDSQCGFRMLSHNAVRKIVLKKDNFEVDSEILLQAALNKLKVAEVPVTSIYAEDHSSNIKPIRDTFRFFSLIIGLYFSKSRYKIQKIRDKAAPKPKFEKEKTTSAKNEDDKARPKRRRNYRRRPPRKNNNPKNTTE